MFIEIQSENTLCICSASFNHELLATINLYYNFILNYLIFIWYLLETGLKLFLFWQLSVIAITNTLVSVSNASFIPEQERKRKLVRQATHGAMELPDKKDSSAFSIQQEQVLLVTQEFQPTFYLETLSGWELLKLDS